jgi:hypothetical protein
VVLIRAPGDPARLFFYLSHRSMKRKDPVASSLPPPDSLHFPLKSGDEERFH